MPTVPRVGPFRFFIYVGDGGEPPHIHVERADAEVKFWLDPVRLERGRGFRRKEINRVRELIAEPREQLPAVGREPKVFKKWLAVCRVGGVFGTHLPAEVSAVLNWFRRKRDPAPPSVSRQAAGTLTVCSGTILLGDPMFSPATVRLEGVPLGKHPVQAQVINYPEGGRRVAGIELEFAPSATGTPELLGEIGVDSATVALVDALTRERFWKAEGPARIGVLRSPQHRTIAKLLRQRFGLRSDPVNVIRSELVQPVSHELEEEIVAYLMTYPEYADYLFMYFRIETRNSYDQLRGNLRAHGLWCDLVLDKPSGANVLAFASGFGDGSYAAYGVKEKGRWSKAVVEFIGPEQEKVLEAFPMLRY